MLSRLIKRARYRYRTEGLMSLLRRSLRFAVRSIFVYETYYLSAGDPREFRELNKAEYTPNLDKVSSIAITTNQEARELEANGFEFFSHGEDFSRRLDKGAVACCTFVGSELACICWLALTQEAQKSIDKLGTKVDFGKNESCTLDMRTIPKYRRKGLMVVNLLKRYEFLASRGIVRNVGAIRQDNSAANRGFSKVGASPYAEARYLRILWLRFWEEKPLTEKVEHADLSSKTSR